MNTAREELDVPETRPVLEWVALGGKRYLKFTFSEHLSAEDASMAIAEWRVAFEENTSKQISLIWEATRMKSYDSAARKLWQNTLKEMKDRIGTIWLVSDSSIIRMGASVMSMFSSLSIRAVGSQKEIKFG